MATYRVSMAELAPTFARVSKQQQDAGIKAMRIAAKTLGLRYVQEAIDSTVPKPVDRGTYRRGWKAQDLPRGVRIFNGEAYASVIEAGRRPGAPMPPPDVLGEWARRKGLLRGIPAGSRKSAQRSIGFALAKAIAKRGQPAKNVLGRAVARLVPEMRAAIAAAMVKV